MKQLTHAFAIVEDSTMYLVKTTKFITAASAALLLLAGCASTPQEDASITQLEQKIAALEPVAGEDRYAPVAVAEAQEALTKLKGLKDNDSEAYQHQLYLTEKQIEIAQELVAAAKAEENLDSAEVRRKDILLEAKTAEAEQAKSLAAAFAVRAQELSHQVEDLRTQETERGLVLTLSSVLFESGKATLHSGAQRTVEKIADFLKEYPDRNIKIEGFTDSQGDEAFNQSLSERRATTVKDLLVSYGVGRDRINTAGYGEEYPIANNNTSEGRQQNRRVEIIIGKSAGANINNRTSMR